MSFSAPSLLQILVQSGIAVLEILLLSRLGTDTLAGISAVFPISTLLIAVTTLGMGGAVASAIARALGAAIERKPKHWRCMQSCSRLPSGSPPR